MYRFHPSHARAALALSVMLVLLLGPATAAAKVTRKAGTPNANPSGLLSISPGRIEADVQPGVRQVFEVQLTDDSEKPFDVTLGSTDLGSAADPRSVASATEHGEFGAGDWITPEVTDLRIEPFETVTFTIVVEPPVDAPVGTNLGGLIIDSTIASGAVGTADSDSAFRIQGMLQIFLTVPGAIDHELRIRDVDVRDAVILGGQRFAVWDITFENRGTVNEHVNGSARVRSIFGNSAYTSNVRELLVLRGSRRTTRVVWRDLPWVGAFNMDVRVRGDDARLVERSSEHIYVFPWWLPLVILLAIGTPWLWVWWRRRREWLLYLEDEGEGDDAG